MTVFTDLSDAPERHYAVIEADPAWKFKTYGPQEHHRNRRDAERHYPTMTLAEMQALPVKRVAARDCWLFMWTTWPHLPQALDLARTWGFRYSSSAFVWFKMKRSFSHSRVFITLPDDMHIGTGYTTRKNTEVCLLFKRGSPRRLSKAVWEPIFAPVREHSRKPDEAHRRIEAFCDGPRLEMNARAERPGWDSWGNEVGKFEPVPARIVAPAASGEEQIEFFEPYRLLTDADIDFIGGVHYPEEFDRPKFTMEPGADEPEDPNVVPFLRRLAGA